MVDNFKRSPFNEITTEALGVPSYPNRYPVNRNPAVLEPSWWSMLSAEVARGL